MNRPTSYTDSGGETRHVKFDVEAFDRILQRLGVDLLTQTDQASARFFSGDPRQLVRVLHCVVAPDQPWPEFQAAHTGEVLAHAEAACFEAFASFFPGLRQRALRALRAAQEEATTALLEQIETAATDGTIAGRCDQEIRRMLAEILGLSPSTSASGSGEPPAF